MKEWLSIGAGQARPGQKARKVDGEMCKTHRNSIEIEIAGQDVRIKAHTCRVCACNARSPNQLNFLFSCDSRKANEGT
jgi:hypothetical protein